MTCVHCVVWYMVMQCSNFQCGTVHTIHLCNAIAVHWNGLKIRDGNPGWWHDDHTFPACHIAASYSCHWTFALSSSCIFLKTISSHPVWPHDLHGNPRWPHSSHGTLPASISSRVYWFFCFQIFTNCILPIVYCIFCQCSTMNKLASLEATLVRNYDPATHWLTDGGKV